MTANEEKALAKAKELMSFFKGLCFNDSLGRFQDVLDDDYSEIAFNISVRLCDENIETLNSMKGMGKIHKVKFWKYVKEFLKEVR